MEPLNTYRSGPDETGHFGLFGGRFVAETLMPLILAVEQAYEQAKADPSFQAAIDHYAKHYVGRPSPLYFAERLTERFGGAKIYFKRDELNHTGAQEFHAEDIGRLALDVGLAHIDDARQVEQRADRGGGDAVLAGAGLGDDPGLAHASGQQDLAHAIVDLVGAGVV